MTTQSQKVNSLFDGHSKNALGYSQSVWKSLQTLYLIENRSKIYVRV